MNSQKNSLPSSQPASPTIQGPQSSNQSLRQVGYGAVLCLSAVMVSATNSSEVFAATTIPKGPEKVYPISVREVLPTEVLPKGSTTIEAVESPALPSKTNEEVIIIESGLPEIETTVKEESVVIENLDAATLNAETLNTDEATQVENEQLLAGNLSPDLDITAVAITGSESVYVATEVVKEIGTTSLLTVDGISTEAETQAFYPAVAPLLEEESLSTSEANASLSTSKANASALLLTQADSNASANDAPPKFGTAGTQRWYLQSAVATDLDNDVFGMLGAGITHFVFDGHSVNLELNGFAFDQPGDNAAGLNLNFLVRSHWIRGDNWSIYVDGGAGIISTTDKVPSVGSSFNFTPQIGGGTSIQLNETQRLMLGLRWHHISNANLYESNPGLDTWFG